MKTKRLTASLILSATLFTAAAQNEADTAKKAKLQFKLSVNYNSHLNYYGRTDSLKSSGFFPMAEFWLTPNFYLSAAPVFVNNAAQNFDYAGTVTTAGYLNVSKKWITGVYVSKPFYKESSDLVQSALKAQSGVNVSFLNRYLNINLGGDVKFSDKVDYGASGGLDHLIRIQNKDSSVWAIDPGVYAYASTQNFQRSYYKKSNGGFLLFPERAQLVTEEVSRFNILAYEVSMPVVYAKKKWTFAATPSYIVPQNLITVPNRPDLSERGESLFYVTLTAKYAF